jgi:hypothetical protein
MEPVKPVYSNIKVIISTVIPIVINSNNLIEILIQGDIIIRLIIYSYFSINKKRNTRKNIIDSGYSRRITTRKLILLLMLLIIFQS